MEGDFLKSDLGKEFTDIESVQVAFDEDKRVAAVYLYDSDADGDGLGDGSEEIYKDIVIVIEFAGHELTIIIKT